MALSKVVKCMGTLTASKFDEMENPLELLFTSERGQEYLVNQGELWQDLIFYIDEYMWISGKLLQDEEEELLLEIESFRVFEDNNEYGYSGNEKIHSGRKQDWDDDL